MRTPRSVRRWCKRLLPEFLRHLDGGEILEDVQGIVENDRWNSFDKFHQTSQFVASRYEKAGAEAEIVPLQTGGEPGNGKWRIMEAWDVESATLRMLRPRAAARVLADYRKNPFHLVMWSSSTPRQGLRGPVVVVDSTEEARRIGAGRLKGCFVLTRHNIRELRPLVVAKGAVGLIHDGEVPGLPDEVEWQKFGWGAWPAETAQLRCVGFCISHSEGTKLRRQIGEAGVELEAKVKTRAYVGHHEVVTATFSGGVKPDDEIWALGHLFEPGPADNASGCAALIGAASLLGRLTQDGKLDRPKRTIRFLHGFENYGHFTYYEERSRFQRPIANIDVDTVGVDPRFCGGNLFWSDSIADSPGYPHLVGSAIFRSTLRLSNPGYKLRVRPFVLAGDNLLGDPRYGVPTPWLTTYPYLGYHSSGDVIERLSARGLEVCTAGIAAYLYYLAQAGNPELLTLANWESGRRLENIRCAASDGARAHERALALVEREVVLHDRTLKGLERLMCGGDRREVLKKLDVQREGLRRAAEVASKGLGGRSRSSGWEGAIERLVRVPAKLRRAAARVPIRSATLAPAVENTKSPHTEAILGAAAPYYSVVFADNRRSVREIAGWVALDQGREPDVQGMAKYFEAMKALGHIQYADPRTALTRRTLRAGLRRLGVRRGMDLMVHSSLSSLGPVMGGADAVIDALRDVIGPTGTLMMPSFNHERAEVFDINTTPTNNGEIPDTFWRRPGVVRSVHATHSLAACGPRARRWTEGHLDTLWMGPESPLGRLIHDGGYILLLGVGHNSNTSYHVAETSMDPPCLGEFMRPAYILDSSGQVRPVKTLQFRAGRCPVSPTELDQVLTEQKLHTQRWIGQAVCTLTKGLDLFHVHRRLLEPHCPTCPVRPHPAK